MPTVPRANHLSQVLSFAFNFPFFFLSFWSSLHLCRSSFFVSVLLCFMPSFSITYSTGITTIRLGWTDSGAPKGNYHQLVFRLSFSSLLGWVLIYWFHITVEMQKKLVTLDEIMPLLGWNLCLWTEAFNNIVVWSDII